MPAGGPGGRAHVLWAAQARAGPRPHPLGRWCAGHPAAVGNELCVTWRPLCTPPGRGAPLGGSGGLRHPPSPRRRLAGLAAGGSTRVAGGGANRNPWQGGGGGMGLSARALRARPTAHLWHRSCAQRPVSAAEARWCMAPPLRGRCAVAAPAGSRRSAPDAVGGHVPRRPPAFFPRRAQPPRDPPTDRCLRRP